MSVTKSIASALLGITFDSHLLQGPGISVSESLPKSDFPNDESYSKFQQVSLKDVLGMSALDAPRAPHVNTPEAKERLREFFISPNRLSFALQQNLLSHPGVDFQYTDVTPLLISGAVEYATGQTLFDLAKDRLFDPMGFQNEEWMHEDAASFDNAAYGARLRPVDMQKLGILYLNQGCWEGRQLISSSWVKTSFTPWIRSKPTNHDPDYGWYWWKDWFNSGWIGHIANGWKGQRIAVFPEKDVVVTMTGAVGDGSENKVFAQLMNDFVIPALEIPSPTNESLPNLKHDLNAAISQVLTGKSRFAANLESRMVPSELPKERHRPFLGVRQ